jgi:ABC-type transport system substrate-binding protein/class 3 adenylate cyclase/streptogramin lyase
LTSDRGFAGTIAYVAPEQIESGSVDARADIYALGCVVFECLAGVPPFEREGDLQVVFAHLKEPPPLVTSFRPDLPEAVDAIVQKALAKMPDERYSTATELVGEVVEALQVAPPTVSHTARRTIPGVRTFLIADVRGYTKYTAEHGDEAAARLATSFAEIVRQVVEEREGRLIELRGDEALVVFDSARQALRSAVEVQRRVAADELPLGVGIGLDAGEAVPVADGYRGGALNMAARLCSRAGPGEVLATETVLSLARAVEGIRYGERRQERVKGIAKPVTAIEVLAGDSIFRRWDRKRLRRLAGRRLQDKRVRLGALGAAALAVAAGVFLALPGSSSAQRIAPLSVGFVSSDGKVEGQLPITGEGPLSVLGNTLWYANGIDKSLQRIDVRTRKFIHPFASVEHGIGGMTTGLGAVWVVDGRDPAVLRVDPRYLTIEKIALPAKRGDIDFTAPTEVITGAGSVWVAEANRVFRVDPKSLRVVKTIEVEQADLLTFGDGALWVGQSNASSVSKIDPATNQVVRTVRLRGWIDGVVAGSGFVWVGQSPDGTLWKLDQSGNVIRTFDIDGPMLYSDGAVWVASNGVLQRVDAQSDEITSFPIVDRPNGLAAANGKLFVATGESPPKLSSLPADEVATFSLSEDWIDDIDPAHAYPSTFRSQLEYATGAQLLNYPDAPAPKGSRLQPEVASAMPAVSRDGRTYTFHVRRGFRFSPSSKQEVTADTFRYSIERALSPALGQGTPGIDLVGDIVGAQAFHDGKAAHVSGIGVRGNTLRITLVAPAGDFLARLSTPVFAAVPLGTPIVNGGVQDHPIPSAGPYYLKLKWQDGLAVLERNPNYTGTRPHVLERIVYDINNSTHQLVSKIENGDADYSADLLGESTFAAGGPLSAKYGSLGANQPLLVQTPQLGSHFFLLNTARGPFVDARLRKAVSHAIDRRALARAARELPSDSFVPPALVATPRVHSLTANLAQARRLARGFHGTVTLYTCTRPDCMVSSRTLQANLAALGMKVEIRQFDDPFAERTKPGARWDLVNAGWYYDWPDAGEAMTIFFGTSGFSPSWAPPSIALPKPYAGALARATRLRGVSRDAAFRHLAVTLARDLVPFAAYATPVLPEFFSARVGCRVEHPITGQVDIGALCVTS